MGSKIVILCGPRPAYGHSPLPPLTNSAPEKNIYRIAEGDYGNQLSVHVISTCNQEQKKILDSLKSPERYHNLLIPDFLFKFFHLKIFTNQFVSAICTRLCYCYDIFSFYYLSKARNIINAIDPEIIIINSMPQYINFIRNVFPNKNLGAFIRGEMGISRKYLHLLDFAITNSNGIKSYVFDLLEGETLKIYQILNSLEMSFCDDSIVEKEEHNRTIIYVGRINPDKGVFELVKALHLIDQVQKKVRLLIIGGNYGKNHMTTYEKTIHDFVKENNLPVTFLGMVPNDQLSNFYQMADLAVFPSICLESFGMVALEAMRCGLPVIASKRPGFEELIDPGETGFLVEDPTDIDDLARTIEKLIADKKFMQKMGEKAHIKSLEFTPEKNNQRFLEIMKQEL